MSVKIINLTKEVKKRTDERGWMINFIQNNQLLSSDDVKNVHLGTISPGSIRGNHYHKAQREWLFVFGGKALMAWSDGEQKKSQEVGDGEYFLFEIPPGTTHAVKNIDFKDIFVCAFADKVFNWNDYDQISNKII